ncbi:MAG TPA: hypothetical protein VMT66_16915 [Steroidobacteraceae bacterium]|nr:hypothetical protein [Steroidobacteraceae bacterium]
MSERQLQDRLRHDRAFRTHIRKVGWLLVSHLQSLFDLDEHRAARLTAVRRAARAQRKNYRKRRAHAALRITRKFPQHRSLH